MIKYVLMGKAPLRPSTGCVAVEVDDNNFRDKRHPFRRHGCWRPRWTLPSRRPL